MIEVGEYVRTKDGYIFKIVDIDNIFIYVDKEVRYIEETNTFIDYIKKSSVVKHSKDIIDLIEVGDYVNGYKVIAKSDDGYIEILTDDIEQGELLEKQDIKTILTKEQYQANCYTVERRKKC